MKDYQTNLIQLKLIEDAYHKGKIKKLRTPVEAAAVFLGFNFFFFRRTS